MSDWKNRIVGHGVKPADQFAAHPNNPRRHPQPQRDAVRASLDTLGWIGVVIENVRTGYLIDGHERVMQALEDNVDVPYIQVDLSEDEEAQALLTLDWITQMAQYDRDALDGLLRSVNSDDAGVQALLAEIAEEHDLYPDSTPVEDAGAQIERAEELLQVWQVERGQLWVIPSKSGKGEHRLLCGDSTSADDVALLCGEKRIEMVWTDPPYGVSVGDKNKRLNAIVRSNRVESNIVNDTLDEPDLLEMLRSAFDAATRYCLAGAAWYVAGPAGPLHLAFAQALKERGIWRQTIQWVKNNATFAPLGVDYHWRSEPIFYGWLPNAGHRYHGGRQQDTVWEIDRPLKSPDHPTMKPVELVARAVENSSRKEEIVYDMFGGSGTTMVACEQLGRQCRMIEIEPKYCSVILQRMKDMGLEPQLVK